MWIRLVIDEKEIKGNLFLHIHPRRVIVLQMIFLLIPLFHFQKKIGHLVGLSIFIQIWRWKEGTSSHLVKEYLLTKQFLEWVILYKPCCEQSEWMFVNKITHKRISWMEKQFIKTLLWRTTRHSLTLKKIYVIICKCEKNVVRWALCTSDYSGIEFFI